MKGSQFRIVSLLILLTFTSFAAVSAQDTVRVMAYNLLRYGAQGIGGCTPTGVTARNTWITDILARAKPDVFGVNEIGPLDSPVSPASNITQNILPNIGYGNFEATNILFESHQDICNMLWFNTDKLGLLNHGLINVTGTRRDLDFYQFYYKSPGTITDSTFLYVVLVHLMSSSASGREDQTDAIMNHLDTKVGGPNNIIVMGDMNMTSANSGAFQTMISHPDLDTRMRDPLNLPGVWNNNNSARHAWSQSTPGGAPCGAGTQLNDRFDLILCSNALLSGGEGMEYITGSHWVMGNPNAPNVAVPSQISASLAAMSDHYPVIMDLEVDRAVSRNPDLETQIGLEIVSPTDQILQGKITLPKGKNGDISLQLYSLQGQLVHEQTERASSHIHSWSTPLPALKAGIYLLKVAHKGLIPTTRKIVILK